MPVFRSYLLLVFFFTLARTDPNRVRCGSSSWKGGGSVHGIRSSLDSSTVVQLKTGGTTIACGGQIIAGTSYQNNFSPRGEYLLEATGCSFSTRGVAQTCSGTYTTSQSASVVCNNVGSTVTITAGWSSGRTTVYYSQACTYTVVSASAPAPTPSTSSPTTSSPTTSTSSPTTGSTSSPAPTSASSPTTSTATPTPSTSTFAQGTTATTTGSAATGSDSSAAQSTTTGSAATGSDSSAAQSTEVATTGDATSSLAAARLGFKITSDPAQENYWYANCDRSVFFLWKTEQSAILTIVLVSIALVVLVPLASFYAGAFRTSFIPLVAWWFCASFLISSHCDNWIAYYCLVFLLVTCLYLAWRCVESVKPGGVLSSLHIARIGVASKFGEIDFSLWGKLNEYSDMTLGQALLICGTLVWVFGVMVERYSKYTAENEDEKVSAAGRALGQAAIRLWLIAEITGHRYGIGWALFRCPHERIVSFHKMTGRLAYLSMSIHGLILVLEVKDASEWLQPLDLNAPSTLLGLLAWIFTTLLILTSIPYIRRANFEMFYFAHVVFKMMMLVTITLHVAYYMVPFTVAAATSMAIDWAIRFTNKFAIEAQLVSAELVSKGKGNEIVRLELTRSNWPNRMGGWEPGSYITLSLSSNQGHPGLSSSVPPSSLLSHPLTIASPPSAGNKIVVMVKNMGPGTWSDALCELGRSHGASRKGRSSSIGSSVRAYVGGPYGKLSIQPKDYHTIVLCCGGIGVTPLAALWGDIALAPHKYPKVKKVVVVWVARSNSVFSAFQEWIDYTNRKHSGISFEIKCFLTEGVSNLINEDKRTFAQEEKALRDENAILRQELDGLRAELEAAKSAHQKVPGKPPTSEPPTHTESIQRYPWEYNPHYQSSRNSQEAPRHITGGKHTASAYGEASISNRPVVLHKPPEQPNNTRRSSALVGQYLTSGPNSQPMKFSAYANISIDSSNFGSLHKCVRVAAVNSHEDAPAGVMVVAANFGDGTTGSSNSDVPYRVIPGRPNWAHEIAQAVHTLSEDSFAGVFACGPGPLMVEVSRAAGEHKRVHLHKEVFEF